MIPPARFVITAARTGGRMAGSRSCAPPANSLLIFQVILATPGFTSIKVNPPRGLTPTPCRSRLRQGPAGIPPPARFCTTFNKRPRTA